MVAYCICNVVGSSILKGVVSFSFIAFVLNRCRATLGTPLQPVVPADTLGDCPLLGNKPLESSTGTGQRENVDVT